MDEKEKVLIENIEEYYELGIEAFIRKKYNSATTLFFKAIATLCDLYILKKEGIIPSSHSKRFKILKDKYSDAGISDLDGLLFTYPDWWFNVRPSNTEPLLRVNIEAETESLLEQARDKIEVIL